MAFHPKQCGLSPHRPVGCTQQSDYERDLAETYELWISYAPAQFRLSQPAFEHLLKIDGYAMHHVVSLWSRWEVGEESEGYFTMRPSENCAISGASTISNSAALFLDYYTVFRLTTLISTG
jgi:hypothetical protein